MLRVAIGTVALADLELDVVLEQITRAGFSDVELMCQPPHFDAHPSARRKVAAVLERCGVRVESAHAPLNEIDLSSPDEAVRVRSREAVAACFAPAAELGARCVVVHGNIYSPELSAEPHYGKSLERTRQSLEELVEPARAAGIRIALENLPTYGPNHGKPRPTHSADELLQLIDGLPEFVGICIDTGHAVLAGLDPADQVRRAAPRLAHVHLQDNDGRNDRHWVPGDGIVDFARVIRSLREVKFAGTATIEVVIGERDRAVETLARCREIARRWESEF